MRLLVSFCGNFNQDPRIVSHRWENDEPGAKPEWTSENPLSQSWTKPEPFDTKQFFVEKGQPKNSVFDVSVSSPSHFYSWLQSNDATQLSMLNVFSSAHDIDSDALPDDPFTCNSGHKDLNRMSEWERLFELLATKDVAPNLKRLKVYWDCYEGWRGLGKSIGFIRALGKLRPKENVTIGGYYADNWPAYLEREMCVPVIEEGRDLHLRRFQSDTRGLIP